MNDKDSGQGETKELAIDVSNLSKTYRDGLIFRKRFKALKQVSFSVQQGEIFGLLGPNGAGKTTFLKIMLGIISKTSGDARMLSYPAGSRQVRRQVGYLPEQLRMPRHLNGLTALDYYGSLNYLARKQIKERQHEVLEMVGLADRAKDAIKKYSKGMLQRLGMAQALLHKPQLLVLDEPTDGLDPGARADMRGIIRQLQNRGVTIFLNSHILQEVELICDRVAILDRGELRYCGSVKEIGKFVNAQAGRTKTSVLFRLAGDKTDVEQVFAQFELVNLAEQDGQMEVTANFESQARIDECVDQLRSRSISLMQLYPESTSLEDAFLQIVQTSQTESLAQAENN